MIRMFLTAQSILYNDIVKEQSRSRLATELMIYHMQVT